jgi:hypothetical protein
VRFVYDFQMGNWIKSTGQLFVDCLVDGLLLRWHLCGGREVDTRGMCHYNSRFRDRKAMLPLASMSDCWQCSSDIVTSATLCQQCQNKATHGCWSWIAWSGRRTNQLSKFEVPKSPSTSTSHYYRDRVSTNDDATGSCRQ